MVTRTMTNIPTPEFQKLRSNLIEYLMLECENTVQYTNADAVMKRVRRVLRAIAHLEGCTPLSVSVCGGGEYQEESPPASEREAVL
jgi:hypothetical protein